MATSAERQRSMTGCLVCKSRKVKCDERPGGCLRCARLAIDCPGYGRNAHDRTRVVEQIYQNAGIARRVVGACRECYAAKAKCSMGKPRCLRCVGKGMNCHYATGSRAKQPSDGDGMSVVTSLDGHPRAVSSEASTEEESFSWLFARDLPRDESLLRLLVDTYFEHIAPLRCLAFIHRATFMVSFNRGTVEKDFGRGLLLAMCALAARVHLALLQDMPLHLRDKKQPGMLWAEAAQILAFQDICHPSVSVLMTLTLLTEYNMRLAQLLRLDQEPISETMRHLSPAAQVTEAESRRRLMWCCYSLDVIIASGVEALMLASWGSLPRIALPRSSTDFDMCVDSPTAQLSPALLLSDQASSFVMGIESAFIIVVWFRNETLRAIRITARNETPWTPASLMNDLITQLDTFARILPAHLQFNDGNIANHQQYHQLSAFFLLHLLYHQCYCDLMRVSLPGYTFPLAAKFRECPAEQRDNAQKGCYMHAKTISTILKKGLQQVVNPFDDPLCAACAYEATKIQIVYITTCGGGLYQEYNEVAQDVLANLTTLRLLRSERDSLAPLLKSLFELLQKFGFGELLEKLRIQGEIDESLTTPKLLPPQNESLHAASTFRLAWDEISWRKPSSDIRNEPPRTSSNNGSSMPITCMIEPLHTAAMVPYVPEASVFTGDSNILPTAQYTELAQNMQGYLTWDPLVAMQNPNTFRPPLS